MNPISHLARRQFLILNSQFLIGLAAAPTLVSTSAAETGDEGWRPLFNGKDLTGWVPVQVAPNTFTVRDGIIVSTGIPTGVMRTDRQYENFELELEWKHIVPQGNAGLFVWSYPITAVGQPFTKSIEVQILDGRNSETHTSHGDIFSIHGARMKPDRPHPRGAERCLPSEWRCKPAGKWNHYRVVCNNGVIKLSVNGKEVSGGTDCTPRKGYICLESEGTECHFRNIRIKELPSTNPKPEETAREDEGFVSIYNGLNLDGWTTKAPEHWKAKDWVLEYNPTLARGEVAEILETTKNYRDFVMIMDFRGKKGERNDYLPQSRDIDVYLRGGGPLILRSVAENRDSFKWNRAVIRARGDRATVEVNGKIFPEADNVQLQGARESGPIGILGLTFPVEFANIYIKELK